MLELATLQKELKELPTEKRLALAHWLLDSLVDSEKSWLLPETVSVSDQEMRLAAAVKWYETERISQAKAAEIAGVSRAEFLAALARFNVSPFQITADELINEANNL